MTLVLEAAFADRVRAHAAEGYPEEVCGLLLGTRAADGSRVVRDVFPLENERTDSRGNRYVVSARSMLTAERYARDVRLDVVGYYHSHPDAPARPSTYDLDHATWPDVSYPIVSVVKGEPDVIASYVLADDRSEFLPEELTTGEAGRPPDAVTE
jgi:proteasome lid subunit RPN8/RPN11